MKNKILSTVLICMFLVGLFPRNIIVSAATSYYVSTTGSDSNDGKSITYPFRTIQKAANVMAAGDTCYIRGGTYRETVTPTNSGTETNRITFANYNGENVIVSGCDTVTGWDVYSGSIYRASKSLSLDDGNQVFVNSTMMIEARWPNTGTALLQPTLATADFGTDTYITDSALTQANGFWNGAKIWILSGAEWICKISTISDYNSSAKKLTFSPAIGTGNTNYMPKAGNSYYLTGKLEALDAPNEWFYSGGYLYLYAPGGVDPDTLSVEVKARKNAFSLSGKKGINITGINIFGATIQSNSSTSYCTYDRISAKYISHQFATWPNGIYLSGSYMELKNSILDTAAGNVVHIGGSNNRLINCLVQNGGYGAGWDGNLLTSGKNHLISHNTIRDSGRDGMTLGARATNVQYNDVYNVGWIQEDMGIIHFGNADGANSRFHHNLLHDGKSDGFVSGIYLDNMDNNFIIDHNVVWGCTEGLQLNSPSRFTLAFNNTFYRGGSLSGSGVRTDYSDWYGNRIFNNIFTDELLPMGGAVLGNNIRKGTDPKFTNSANYDFTLQAGSPAIDAGIVIQGITDGYLGAAPDCGAYEYGTAPWKAGHDFSNPPNPEYIMITGVPYENLIANSSFEDSLNGWTKTGTQSSSRVSGDPWADENTVVFAQQYAVRLGSGANGVEQTVTGLQPNTTYTFSCWVKVNAGETVQAGIKNFGAETVSVSSGPTLWQQLTADFTTGASNTWATVFVNKISSGSGYIYSDLVGLQLKDPQTKGDSFENGLADWNVSGGKVSNAKSRSGNNSYLIDDGKAISRSLNNIYIKKFSIWLYDDSNDSSVQAMARADEGTLSDEASWRGIGINTNYSKTNYCYRVGTKWYVTSIPRTNGWHKLTWNYTTGQQLDMYIDDVLINTVAGVLGCSFFAAGDWSADGSLGQIYFDDYIVADLDEGFGSFDHSMGGWVTSQTPMTTFQWKNEKHNGGRGYKLDEDVDYLSRSFASSQNNIVTMWIYDTATDGTLRAFGRVDNGAVWRGLGVSTDISSSNYVVRINDTVTATNVPRATGWHELKWDYRSGERVDMYIDSFNVASDTSLTSYTSIALGDWWSDTYIGNPSAYFDEVSIKDTDGVIDSPMLFSDGFENDLGIWSASGGTLNFSSVQKRSGERSLVMDQDFQVIDWNFKGKIYNKKVSIWMYDNAGDGTVANLVRADDGTNWRGLGVSTGTSTTHFVYRIGNVTTPTNIPRKTGWHQLLWDYTSGTDVKLYIDGILVNTSTGLTAFSKISVIDYWTDNTIGPCYYDDFEIFDEQEQYKLDFNLYTNYGTPQQVNITNSSLQSGNITCKATIENKGVFNSWETVLLLALYKNEKLMSIKRTPLANIATPAKDLLADINIPDLSDGQYKLKIMVWDNADIMKPLHQAKLFDEINEGIYE